MRSQHTFSRFDQHHPVADLPAAAFLHGLDPKQTNGLLAMVGDLRPVDGHAGDRRFAFPVDLISGRGGDANPWRTISAGGCLPTHTQGSRSGSDKPDVSSSAVDRAVAGGCARDPFCRTTGKARRCGSQPPAQHRKAQPVDVTLARRTPLPGTDRALFTTARLRSRFGRQAPDRNRGCSRCARWTDEMVVQRDVGPYREIPAVRTCHPA